MKNIFWLPLKPCCYSPMTGYFRDGYCRTDISDSWSHTVCAIMTEEFLKFSKSRWNDLSTPMPQYGFPGLKAGDRWCLCASRWQEAYEAGKAPKVILESCHEKSLEYIDINNLVEYGEKESI